MPKLTVARLKEVLDYNPKTGVFTWKVSRGRMRAGSVAGSLNGKGYWRVNLFGRKYLAHRLAWFYTKGRWPPHGMDHLDGKPRDNRIAKIRPATQAVNLKNQRRRSDNTSGVVGVCWDKEKLKWRTHIQVDGKSKHLGYFTNKEEAARARKKAEKKYGFHANHGRR